MPLRNYRFKATPTYSGTAAVEHVIQWAERYDIPFVRDYARDHRRVDTTKYVFVAVLIAPGRTTSWMV